MSAPESQATNPIEKDDVKWAKINCPVCDTKIDFRVSKSFYKFRAHCPNRNCRTDIWIDPRAKDVRESLKKFGLD